MFLDNDDHKRAEEAVGIARISDGNQEMGYSKEAQKHRIKEYCIRHGLELIKIFEFTESSTIDDRKKFTEAIDYAKKRKGNTAVVTDKVDRLQRSYKEVSLLEKLIKDQKIELHFHVENLCIHKGSKSQDLMIWDMHIMMAKSYVNCIKDNVNRGIEQKLRNGEWIATAPIGYKHIKAEPGSRFKGQIVVDQDRAPIIKRLFEDYATGTYTLRGDIWHKAKEWGLTSIYGKKGFLSKSQVHAMIQNPFYYGMMLYKKRNRLYPHRYTPLISKATYDQCQAVRKGWNKKPFKYADKQFLFRGILRCAISNRSAITDIKKKKYANGKTAEWTYLRVQSPSNPEKTMFVREEKVIEQVADIFKALKLNPETLAEVVKHIKMNANDQQSYHEKRLIELNKEMITTKRRMSKLTNLFLDGDISKEAYNEKKTELDAERDNIVCELEQYNEADDNFTNTLIGLVEVASGAYDAFKVGTFEEKRHLLNFVFSNLELKGSTLCYSLKKPFDRFAKCNKIEGWWAR